MGTGEAVVFEFGAASTGGGGERRELGGGAVVSGGERYGFEGGCGGLREEDGDSGLGSEEGFGCARFARYSGM